MNTYTLIFGILLCFVASNARNFEPSDVVGSEDDQMEGIRRAREHSASQMRHKRRSWHNNYGYDYPLPPNPYYPDRRDYDQQSQQDLMPQIWRLLEEISSYVRRPPPPPQPIYVPFAVPYPVPQQCKCQQPTKGPKDDQNPDIGNRFKGMEDERIWGLVDSNENNEEEGDGTRPISFLPIPPKRPSKRPAVQVDHGSTQAGVTAAEATTLTPLSISEGSGRLPSMCDVFSLSCCSGTPQQQKQCFTNVGCSMSYDNGKACDQSRILAIIDAYSKAYSPIH